MIRRLRQVFAVIVPAILVLVLMFVLLCYLNRWDEFVVVTLIPMWAWAGVGTLVSLICWPLLKSRFCLLTFGLWFVTGIALSDETSGLLREFHAAVTGNRTAPTISPATGQAITEHLRVVTLNCDDGTVEATKGIAKLRPDIVLLQEAPERAALIDLTSELFDLEGSFIRSEQCAILARGRLTESTTDPETGSLVATLIQPSGERIHLVNAHLPRATPRFDIWNASTRQELMNQRKTNRRTLRDLLELLPKTNIEGKPSKRLVGGSFGAPPSDDVYRLLRRIDLTDSFRQAGYGWGNTYPGRMPLLRVDSVWSSEHFKPVRSEALASEASDHRFVVTDFQRRGPVGKLALVD